MSYKELRGQALNASNLKELMDAETAIGKSGLSEEDKTTLFEYVRARAGNL